MKILIGAMALAAVLGSPAVLAQTAKPTIVLVHGAFADASGWNSVISQLNKDGYTTIAAANPLRSLAGDAAQLSALVKSIKGDVVLVGHSYAGLVVTEAASGNSNVKALVYVAAFIPDAGESAATLSAKFPGSTLGDTLQPVDLPDGGKDLYIKQANFPDQFAADIPLDVAALMAQTQRPITEAALGGASTVATWKAIPSFSIYGSGDLNIPAAAQVFMADRAKVVKAVEIDNASHVLMISHPREVVELIEAAAKGQVTAMAGCTHASAIHDVEPSSLDGCPECIALGDRWVHLRICLSCGQVGCCDSSKNRHARRHFEVTAHPVIASFQPGEDWRYCYADDMMLEPGPMLAHADRT